MYTEQFGNAIQTKQGHATWYGLNRCVEWIADVKLSEKGLLWNLAGWSVHFWTVKNEPKIDPL